jgi:hypothetical protein
VNAWKNTNVVTNQMGSISYCKMSVAGWGREEEILNARKERGWFSARIKSQVQRISGH